MNKTDVLLVMLDYKILLLKNFIVDNTLTKEEWKFEVEKVKKAEIYIRTNT